MGNLVHETLLPLGIFLVPIHKWAYAILKALVHMLLIQLIRHDIC